MVRRRGEGRYLSIYLSICGLRKSPGKILMGSWKVLDFLSVKEWEPCMYLWSMLFLSYYDAHF